MTLLLLAFVAGALVWFSSSGDAGPGLPSRTAVPRPDERSARDVASARVELSQNKDLGAVIKAAEAGDVDALLSLAVRAGDNYCGSFRELPNECSSRDEKLESVFLNQPSLRPFPAKTMRDYLDKLFKKGGKATLAFATRDSRFPEGNGGEYYLMFETEDVVDLGGGYVANGLELKAKPGSKTPIQWFEIANKDTNPLEWIQAMDDKNGAKYHILITPRSLKDWQGLE